MKILNEEHFQNVKRYAESIGDKSLQNCLDRLKKWEENPDHPSEISLYYDPVSYTHLDVYKRQYVYNEYRWKGRNYNGQSAPEITELVRAWLKETYPRYTFRCV